MMIEFLKQTFSYLSRITAFTLGGIYASLKPAFPFVLICLFAIALDCFTAWRLARRVRDTNGKNDGKFKSEHARRIFSTFFMICLIIFLCHYIDTHILYFVQLNLANMISGAFCFVQLLSILENESSQNDSTWAQVLQKVLVDKAKRHFEINLDEVWKEETKKKKTS